MINNFIISQIILYSFHLKSQQQAALKHDNCISYKFVNILKNSAVRNGLCAVPRLYGRENFRKYAPNTNHKANETARRPFPTVVYTLLFTKYLLVLLSCLCCKSPLRMPSHWCIITPEVNEQCCFPAVHSPPKAHFPKKSLRSASLNSVPVRRTILRSQPCAGMPTGRFGSMQETKML